MGAASAAYCALSAGSKPIEEVPKVIPAWQVGAWAARYARESLSTMYCVTRYLGYQGCTKHKTQNKTKHKTKRFKRTTRSPESVLFVFYFSRPPVFGGNIQLQRYVTMASSAVDRRRNRLGHGKSNMLVGLFHNLRLLKRMRKLLYTEQCVGWNDEDEKTGSFALVLSSL